MSTVSKSSFRWLSRRFVIATLFTGSLFGMAACSSLHLGSSSTPAAPMQASPRIPSAEGAVSVENGDNGNYKVGVSVKHMAPPERVATGASSYVVWLRPLAGDQKAQPPMNVGALAVNKDLEGNLTTVTPYRQFDLFVTAEPVSNTTAPTGEQLLTTTVRR
jgi:hypothetical protein